jgi:hypothetical protein
MNRAIALLICCLGLSAGLPAGADTPASSPHWSFEIKGGEFQPELSDWKKYFGSDSMNLDVVALGYMPLRALQLGAEVGYTHDDGQGLLPLNGTLGGDVSYTLVPVHVYLVVRGVFTAGQWLIPYVGGGWTRAYYKQEVATQQKNEGHADGWNTRAGLQLLLNPLDPSSAEKLKKGFGIDYTYLTLEAQKFSAKIDGTDLGGKSYLLGVRVEY